MPVNVAAPQKPPSTESQWAIDYLAYIGAPASGPNDPRVQFLVDWENEEGTFSAGNTNNPLSTELKSSDSGPQWNSQGVQTYKSPAGGFAATEATMGQSFDSPIFTQLKNPKASRADLLSALGASNWSGYGGGSPQELSYASAVGGATITPAGAQGTASGVSTAPFKSSSGAQDTSPGSAGFLHTLQGILNPSYGNVLSFLGNPGSDAQKLAIMIIARGSFVLLGIGVTLLGVGIAFVETSKSLQSNVANPIRTIQQVTTAGERRAQSAARIENERIRAETARQAENRRQPDASTAARAMNKRSQEARARRKAESNAT